MQSRAGGGPIRRTCKRSQPAAVLGLFPPGRPASSARWRTANPPTKTSKSWREGGPSRSQASPPILPEYLEELSKLQAWKADLDARLKSTSDQEDEEAGGGVNGADELSAEEIKVLKKDLTATRKQIKALQKEFVDQLQSARLSLDDTSARELILAILKAELRAIIDSYVARHRDVVVAAFETWWNSTT